VCEFHEVPCLLHTTAVFPLWYTVYLDMGTSVLKEVLCMCGWIRDLTINPKLHITG